MISTGSYLKEENLCCLKIIIKKIFKNMAKL